MRWWREGGRAQLPAPRHPPPPVAEAWERSTTLLLSHTSSSASSTGRAGAWRRNMALGVGEALLCALLGALPGRRAAWMS